MKRIAMMVMMMLPMVFSVKLKQCQCPCPCQPDGNKLKELINCFATWGENVATDHNSYTEGCEDTNILHCRVPKEEDQFCKFDGTNNLVETNENPSCYYNCGMQTCNAFLIAHTMKDMECIAEVFTN